MTISIKRDHEHPHAYRCGNFASCGMSSSHDPEYVGWHRSGWTWYCSSRCALAATLRRAADSL